jgi:hypothetical protein
LWDGRITYALGCATCAVGRVNAQNDDVAKHRAIPLVGLVTENSNPADVQ